MKNKLFIYISLISVSLFSQSSIGFIDNYSGIQSVIYNPANIADTPYQLDINILSVSGSFGNTNYTANPYNFIDGFLKGTNNFTNLYHNIIDRKLEKIEGVETNPSDEDYYYGNFIVLGPSFSWKLDEYSAFAVTSSLKNYVSSYQINSNFFNALEDYTFGETNEDLLINSEDNFTQVHSWIELGLSYGRIYKESTSDVIKVGASLKFLKGIANYSYQMNDLTLNQNNNTITGNVTNTYSLFGGSFGLGLDLGLVYEKRLRRGYLINSQDENGNIYFKQSPYLYKIALSVTDIGFLKYNDLKNNEDNPNEINLDLSSPYSSFDVNYYLNINSNNKEDKTFVLPTTTKLNFDYNFKNNWFLNANLDLYLLSTNSRDNIKYVSNLVVTPRYETEILSTFFPVTYNRFNNLKMGFGVKTGYFYIGSSSIITNFTNLSKEGDIYLGVKIPFYNLKNSSRDKRSRKDKDDNKGNSYLRSKRI